MKDEFVIGVDIGGTTISVGCFSGSHLIAKAEVDTLAFRSRGEILLTLLNTIDLIWRSEVKAIGIGVPGFFNSSEGVITKISNIPSFNGINLAKHVSEHFKVPVSINNDANCFAMGENSFGSLKKCSNMIGITLGTGLGAGIVISDQIVAGFTGGAGELGQIPYLDKTFEDYCSGKYFLQNYQLKGSVLFEQAEQGNRNALEIFEKFGEHLAQLVKMVVFFINPEGIVFGGSVSQSYKFFSPSMFQCLEKNMDQTITERLVIAPSKLTDAGIYGAAALVFKH